MVMTYTAPTTPQTPAIGTSGLPFGLGMFSWEQNPDGTYGWFDRTSGRRWDATGSPYQTQTPAQTQAQQTPGTGLIAQQGQAKSILDALPAPNRINSAAFLRLPKSAQQFTLGAYAAKGFDEGDVAETIQKILPTSTGPKRGYISPLGA